jgi:hypothetical protein
MKFKEYLTLEESINKKDWQEAINATEIEAEEMVVKNWSKFDGKTINHGFCDVFAYNLKKRVKGIILWETEDPDGSGTYGHVIVNHKGVFYDAECPKGVKTTDEIPYSIRCKELTGDYAEFDKL